MRGAGLEGYGSSPLARGLLWDQVHQDLCRGIIPARAGFTGLWTRKGRSPADHPRSRGVYAYSYKLSVTSDGSSPLARGLLIRVEIKYRQTGIIPARAGFTR